MCSGGGDRTGKRRAADVVADHGFGLKRNFMCLVSAVDGDASIQARIVPHDPVIADARRLLGSVGILFARVMGESC